MSLSHRLLCCVLSISLALPATPALVVAQGVQKSKGPATRTQSRPPATQRGITPPSKAPAGRAQATPKAQGNQAAPAEKPIDLRYVQPDAFAVVVVHPRAVFEAPGMDLVPREVITAAAMKEAGIDPTKIDRAIISVANFAPPSEPTVAGVAYFSEPFDPQRVLAPIRAQAKQGAFAGKSYWTDPRANLAFHMPDNRTIVVAPEPVLKQLLSAQGTADSPIARRLQKTALSADAVAILSIDSVREQVNALLAQVPPLPPPFQEFTKIPDLTSDVEVRVQLGGKPDFELTFHARNNQAAELERLLLQAIAVGKEAVLAQVTRELKGDDPVEQATAQYMRRVVDHFAGVLKPVRTDDRVAISLHSGGGAATIGVLVALLLPAVQAAREAARRTASMNNMKQIALAMHNYHDATKFFPQRAILDKQGKPLLSWRVQILPYIEDIEANSLHRQFRLDEPWDSEHNKKLLANMPAVYRNPNLPGDTKTNYLVPVGEGTMFSGDKPPRIRDITDGTSKTIMLLEVDADRAVPWTKPDDFEVDADDPLAGLGHLRAGGVFAAGFADGSVRFISRDIDAENFLRLIKKGDGEVVELP
jgi:type II secretory pathway pseudopilin PulG